MTPPPDERERTISPDGTLNAVSASQITNFHLCPGRWYFDKKLGMRQPETPEMAEGTRLHTEMEDYYLKGQHPTNLSILELLKDPRIPRPGEGLKIEFPKDYGLGIFASGVRVKGRIDLLDCSNKKSIGIWDWKSRGKLKSAKSPDDLERDVQGLIYGQFVFETFEPSQVRFYHGNIARTERGARVTEVPAWDREYVRNNYQAIVEPTVREMVDVAKVELEEVPLNTRNCFAFRRPCPYINQCPAHKADFTFDFDTPEEVDVTLKERLEARKKAAAASTEAAPTPRDTVADTQTTAPEESKPAPNPVAVVRATGINPPDAAKPLPVTPWTPPTNTIVVSNEVIQQAAEFTAALDSVSSTSTTQLHLHLYVDCTPRKGVTVFTLLSDEISRRAKPIAEAAGKTDVREIKFGEGVAALAATFRKDPLFGHVLVTSSGLSLAVLDILEAQATTIVGR